MAKSDGRRFGLIVIGDEILSGRRQDKHLAKMMRSSVVLPQPDGPSKATSSPDSMSRLTLFSAVKSPNCLSMLRISMLMVQTVVKEVFRLWGVLGACWPKPGVLARVATR